MLWKLCPFYGDTGTEPNPQGFCQNAFLERASVVGGHMQKLTKAPLGPQAFRKEGTSLGF